MEKNDVGQQNHDKPLENLWKKFSSHQKLLREDYLYLKVQFF